MHRRTSALAIATALLLVFVVAPGAGSAPAKPALPADFNGDGFQDLAVGAAWLEPFRMGADQKGLVTVLYGSATGLTAAGNQAWSLDSPGVKGVAPRQAGYGEALASADFDGDGYADLAVAVAEATVSGTVRRGLVSILYGSAVGLTADRDALLPGDSILGDGHPRVGVSRMTADDFDGDGYGDLVLNGDAVVPGSATGLDVAGAVALGLPADALASGHIDGDAYPDLLVLSGGDGPGVTVVPGSATGLDPSGAVEWGWNVLGLEPYGYGEILRVLDTGDIDGDGRDEVALGASDLRVETCDCSAGGVFVIKPGATREAAPDVQVLTQDSTPLPGTAEPRDFFGEAVALGDLDGDGFADLAVGAPGESLGDLFWYGTVTLVYGAADGLDLARSLRVSQSTAGIPSAAEEDDLFGMTLASLRLGRTAAADLVIGVPGEDVGSIEDAGMVNVLYGAAGGLSGSGAQGWSQDSPGIRDAAETGDCLGSGIAR